VPRSDSSRIHLEGVLSTAHAGPTIVVTHHAVHWNSVDLDLCNDLVSAAYVSHLSLLIEIWRPTPPSSLGR
jgi:hypothetical protein